MLTKLSDSQIQTILKSMVILVDTREQSNAHILKYLDAGGIKHVSHKLDFGDYSCKLPAIPGLDIVSEVSFADSIAIERKNSLEELSGNLSKDRDRFEREFERAGEARLILMVEDGSLQGIIEHKYDTNMSEKSYLASLFSFQHRYGLHVNFIPRKYAGAFIYYQLYYWIRNYLKGVEG